MKVKQITLLVGLTLLLIGAITLPGCNAGSDSIANNKNFATELSESTPTGSGTIVAPFDGSKGYDSIHQRMADYNCFLSGGAEARSSNHSSVQPSWQIAETDINQEQYFYSENQKSVMFKLGLAISSSFHDSDDAIVEKESINLKEKIRMSIADNWSHYGINLYGLATRRYTVSYVIPNDLKRSLSKDGQAILLAAQSLNDPTKEYQYFVERCGDNLVSSWNYFSFVMAHMRVTNTTQDLQLAINDYTSGSGSGSSGIGDIGDNAGASGNEAISGLLNSLDSHTQLSWDISGTGNVDTATPNICSTTNASSCNDEVVTPFFQSISDWSTQNKRSKTTSGIQLMPIPGQQYLPAAAWDGASPKLYSISSEIQLLFGSNSTPNPVNEPKMFIYANLINRISNLSDIGSSYLATLTELMNSNYCETTFKGYYEKIKKCNIDLYGSKDTLTDYVKNIAYTSGSKISPHDGGPSYHPKSYYLLQHKCTPIYGGDLDSDECHKFLAEYIEPQKVPYEMLLDYQNKSQDIELIRRETAAESSLATLRYRLKYATDDANNDGLVYSFLRGNTNPLLWGGNQIIPKYLVSEYGDFTATFINNLGNPYNIYLGNGAAVGVNQTASNSLYVIPGGYTSPLNSQNLHISMIGHSDLNLDGYFLSGGDIKLYDRVIFSEPSEYIYAECKINCKANIAGYLLIVSKNFNLYEYAVFNDYSLHQIWSASNSNLYDSQKILVFSSTSGLLQFLDPVYPNNPKNTIINSAPSYSATNPAPEDGIKRYALSLSSSTGALEIYKYGNPNPVWSNIDQLVNPSQKNSNPTNINQDSFWYNYQIESPESPEV